MACDGGIPRGNADGLLSVREPAAPAQSLGDYAGLRNYSQAQRNEDYSYGRPNSNQSDLLGQMIRIASAS